MNTVTGTGGEDFNARFNAMIKKYDERFAERHKNDEQPVNFEEKIDDLMAKYGLEDRSAITQLSMLLMGKSDEEAAKIISDYMRQPLQRTAFTPKIPGSSEPVINQDDINAMDEAISSTGGESSKPKIHTAASVIAANPNYPLTEQEAQEIADALNDYNAHKDEFREIKFPPQE